MKWILAGLVALLVFGSLIGCAHQWGLVPASILGVVWSAVIYAAVWTFDLLDLKDSSSKALVVCMLPLAIIAGIAGNRIFPTKTETAQENQKKDSAIEKRADDEEADKKEGVVVLNNLVTGVAETNALLQEKIAADDRHHTELSSKFEDLRVAVSNTIEKMEDIATPAPPPPEVELPPLPSQPTFETVPKKQPPKNEFPLPKAEEIPSSEPKRQLPDLWVWADKRAEQYALRTDPYQWTHALGSCGSVHAIIGWTTDAQGRPASIYGPCRDAYGFPACSFVQFGKRQ